MPYCDKCRVWKPIGEQCEVHYRRCRNCSRRLEPTKPRDPAVFGAEGRARVYCSSRCRKAAQRDRDRKAAVRRL